MERERKKKGGGEDKKKGCIQYSALKISTYGPVGCQHLKWLWKIWILSPTRTKSGTEWEMGVNKTNCLFLKLITFHHHKSQLFHPKYLVVCDFFPK